MAMNGMEFKFLTSELKRYELTEIEKRFVSLAGEHFTRRGILSEQQETVLRGIYTEKKRWGFPSLKKGLAKNLTYPIV
jgi:hypothetical protein